MYKRLVSLSLIWWKNHSWALHLFGVDVILCPTWIMIITPWIYLHTNDGLIIINYVIRSFVLRASNILERPGELTIYLLKNSDNNYSCRNAILTILIFIIRAGWGTSFPSCLFFYYNAMHMQHEQETNKLFAFMHFKIHELGTPLSKDPFIWYQYDRVCYYTNMLHKSYDMKYPDILKILL